MDFARKTGLALAVATAFGLGGAAAPFAPLALADNAPEITSGAEVTVQPTFTGNRPTASLVTAGSAVTVGQLTIEATDQATGQPVKLDGLDIALNGPLTLTGETGGTSVIWDAGNPDDFGLPRPLDGPVTLMRGPRTTGHASNPVFTLGGNGLSGIMGDVILDDIDFHVTGGGAMNALGSFHLAQGATGSLTVGANTFLEVSRASQLTNLQVDGGLAFAQGAEVADFTLGAAGNALFGYTAVESGDLASRPGMPNLFLKAGFLTAGGSVATSAGTNVAVQMGNPATAAITAGKATFAPGGRYAISNLAANKTYTLLAVDSDDTVLDSAGTIQTILAGQDSQEVPINNTTTTLVPQDGANIEGYILKVEKASRGAQPPLFNVLLTTKGRGGDKALDTLAAAAILGGVPQAALATVTAVGDLIGGHAAAAMAPRFSQEERKSVGVWAAPFYKRSKTSGAEATGGRGTLGYDNDVSLGGGLVGVDRAVSDSLRLGLALNAGGGTAESGGRDFFKVENDFRFFGASLYGAYALDAMTLSADLGYEAITNDLEANGTPSGRAKGSTDTDAFTAGVTGAYKFALESLDVTPHAGLRYVAISAGDANLGGATVGLGGLSLFQIPVGLAFSKDIATEGSWWVSPAADLGAVFTLGDTEAEGRATLAGARGLVKADIAEKTAFKGNLGLRAESGEGFSLALGYGLTAGPRQTDHSLAATLAYEF